MQGVLAIGLAKLQNIGHFEAHFFFDHPISPVTKGHEEAKIGQMAFGTFVHSYG